MLCNIINQYEVYRFKKIGSRNTALIKQMENSTDKDLAIRTKIKIVDEECRITAT